MITAPPSNRLRCGGPDAAGLLIAMKGFPRFVAGVLAAPLLALLLAGCYPDLDWRTLASADGRFSVLMPARSQEESRPIAEGAVMHQWATRAEDALFAAGYADYPDAAASHLATVQAAFAAKGGKLAAERDIQQEGLAGRAFSIEYPGDNEPVLSVRLLAADHRLYQMVVLSRSGKPTKDDLDMFFGSFRLTK
jgi:hypothetical protein